MLLTLDLGGSTGYGILYPRGDIKLGSLRLTRGNIGGNRSPLPMVRLWRRLHRIFDYLPITRIVFEETFARGHAKHRLDQLQAVVMLFCVLNGIKFVRVSPTGWKKAVLGRNCSKAEYHAAALQQFPELRILNDDMAAALWLIEYAKPFIQAANRRLSKTRKIRRKT